MQPPPHPPFQVFNELTVPLLQNRNVLLLSRYQIQVTCHVSQHTTDIFTQLQLFCMLCKAYFNKNWHFLNVYHHTNTQGPVVDGANFLSISEVNNR